MGAFEDFVNLELPRRPVMLTYEITAYAGDPNDPGAPAIVKNSPKGSFYLRNSDNALWRKELPASGTWSEVAGGGGGGSGIVTEEALTFSIDYNDVTAATIPSGTVFARQSEITAFLAAAGTSNFKYVVSCWLATPPIIRHQIIFNLVAGVHRPRNPETNWGAWQFTGKLFQIPVYTAIQFNGAPGSQYTQIVPSTAITGISGGDDPYIDFTGAPFTGLNLKGMFVVLNTGQITVINKHTSSRLYVMNLVSPSPASGFVGKPSTVLRNSYDDISPTPDCYYGVYTEFPLDSSVYVLFSDIEVSGFGGVDEIYTGIGSFSGSKILIDHAGDYDNFGVVPIATMVDVYDKNASAYLSISSLRGGLIATTPIAGSKYPIYCADGVVSFANSYLAGSDGGIHVAGATASLSIARTVLDSHTPNAIEILERSAISLADEYRTGRKNIIRNCGGGLSFWGGALVAEAPSSMQFENVAGDCIQLSGQNCKIGTEYGYNSVFTNGPAGGNLGYGIVFNGQQEWARLRPGTDVSGALGEVKFGGVVMTHAEIVSDGPFADNDGNWVRHD